MFVMVRSGRDVIELKDGQRKIRRTRPINFMVRVKYFYFYSEKGAG